MDTTSFEIVATLVTFEQENPASPTKLSFRTTQRVQIETGTSLSNNAFISPMVLWRDYLMGSYVRAQSRTHGLFLWSMSENSIFYFEVSHSFFSFPGALKLNSRQMEVVPHCTKVVDDLLFTRLNTSGTHRNTTYRCIHIPSLVTSTQLPGGSLSLTKDAFAVLLPKCIMESRAVGSKFSASTIIYSIPASPPTRPRYCFIIKLFPRQPQAMGWEIIEVEIDWSIPGPIKLFSGFSRRYTVEFPTYPIHEIDNDLLLYLRLGRGSLPRASLGVQFLRVGTPGKARLVRLGGVGKMRLYALNADRDAGCVIIWAAKNWPWSNRDRSFIWWLDERKPGNTVYSRTKELISSWSRGLR